MLNSTLRYATKNNRTINLMAAPPTPFVILPSSHARAYDTFPDADELASLLREQIRGEVRFDAASKALYATDASNYRHVPIGVVIPRDEEDVIAAVSVCRAFEAPILTRGAGTSLAGQGCNFAVVFDFSKYMNGMGPVDPVTRTVHVQPGIVLDRIREAAERFDDRQQLLRSSRPHGRQDCR